MKLLCNLGIHNWISPLRFTRTCKHCKKWQRKTIKGTWIFVTLEQIKTFRKVEISFFTNALKDIKSEHVKTTFQEKASTIRFIEGILDYIK